MWWPLQSPETQAAFRALIDRGAIEIVGGGWVQSDEVTLTFEEMIDQTTTGHEWVRENLNVTVKHGYQIDMFAGYSGLTPSIWALSGYEAMLLRYEGNDTMRAEWAADRAFEYVWHASASLGFNESSIFAHVVNGNYGDLCGSSFCFEGSPAQNPPVTPANISARAATLAAFVNARSPSYRGSDLLLLWGHDFGFWNADVMFGNVRASAQECVGCDDRAMLCGGTDVPARGLHQRERGRVRLQHPLLNVRRLPRRKVRNRSGVPSCRGPCTMCVFLCLRFGVGVACVFVRESGVVLTPPPTHTHPRPRP